MHKQAHWLAAVLMAVSGVALAQTSSSGSDSRGMGSSGPSHVAPASRDAATQGNQPNAADCQHERYEQADSFTGGSLGPGDKAKQDKCRQAQGKDAGQSRP